MNLTISLWIVRERHCLWAYQKKPKRCVGYWSAMGDSGEPFLVANLPDRLKNLTVDDEPQQVKLRITDFELIEL